jgi:hypothetical protein
MKKRLRNFTILFSILAAFILAVVPGVSAQGVDEKIKVLEEELSRLKAEQMELKREATAGAPAAAAALPTFEYRPLAGLTIMAADRSWAIKFNFWGRTHWIFHTDGEDHRGGVTGHQIQTFARPFINYCWNNCFYEFRFGWDFDRHEAGGDTDHVQEMAFTIAFNQINPYFPQLVISDESQLRSTFPGIIPSGFGQAHDEKMNLFKPGTGHPAGHRSNKPFVGVRWINVPVGPGDITSGWGLIEVASSTNNGATTTDRRDLEGDIWYRPMSRSKMPWIERLKVGIGVNFMSIDARAPTSNALSIFTDEPSPGNFPPAVAASGGVIAGGSSGRMPLFAARGIGDGDFQAWAPGIEWGYGPYTARFIYGDVEFDKGGSRSTGAKELRDVEATEWTFENELFLWSPRGPLTGSTRTANSILAGYKFDRVDAQCGGHAGLPGSSFDCDPGAGSFNKIAYRMNAFALWWYIQPYLKVGGLWKWYDTSNTPMEVQKAVNCKKNPTDSGKNCDWHVLSLVLWGQW